MLIGNLTEVSLISGLTTTRGIEMLIGKSAEVSRVWGLTTTHGIEVTSCYLWLLVNMNSPFLDKTIGKILSF
jgi:hypothetical protein